MNAIARTGSASVIDSGKILDLQEKAYFNQILQQEIFAADAQGDARAESAKASLGACQARLQEQARLLSIMPLPQG